MSEELTWHEALEMLRADPEARVRADGLTYRMRQDGVLECRDDYDTSQWRESILALTDIMGLRWRRVPAVPRVHELAAKWHGVGHAARACALELEAALAADELVSLKGVTAESLAHIYGTAPFSPGRGIVAQGLQAVLDHLRKGVVKP